MTHPFVDPTELAPEEWQGYLANARKALHANPQDHEALQAIRDANSALGVYDEAEAAFPGERISAGVKGGFAGLGQAALDIPRGVASLLAHPIQTVENIPKIPGALKEALTSDDPEAVSRGVGDIGGMLLPFAKAGRAGSFSLGAPEGPTVGALTVGIGKRLLGRVAQIPRTAGALLDRPQLTNELLRTKIAAAARQAQPDMPPPAAPETPPPTEPSTPQRPELPVHPDAIQAMRDFEAGKISGADLRTAMDVAAGRQPADATAQTPVVPQVSQAGVPPRISNPQPIPGSPQGISVVGPPTPPAPTAPTVAEMQPSVAGLGTGKTLPYYPRGGQVEQSMAPPPVQSPLPAGGLPQSPQEIAASLKDQLSLARSLGQEPTPEALTRILQSKGVAPDQIPAVIDALNPSYTGGGFENVSSAIQHPAYQRASILANRIVGDPQLVQQYPQFAGQTAEQATATLRKMLVAHAEAGGEMPPLTSLSRFLARLTTGKP
jgi:hypothetical protein